MKKSELRAKLIEELRPFFLEFGFKFQRSMDWFIRKHGEISEMFRLDFYTAGEGYGVISSVAIRHETVERLLNELHGLKLKNAPTVWIAIWRLRKSKEEIEYELSLVDDLEVVKSQLQADFVEIGLPFIKSYGSLAGLESLFNEDPTRNRVRFHGLERFLRALLLAKLVGRDNYEEIKEVYKDKIPKDLSQESLLGFEEFAEKLENMD